MFMMNCMIFWMVSLIILLVGNLMGKKASSLGYQGSPFECGVNVLEFSEVPLSVRFYMLMVIFLIFDIELVLLVPFVLYFFYGSGVFFSVSFILFLMLLLVGVFVEWNNSLLEWV